MSGAGLGHVRRITKLKDPDLGWMRGTDSGIGNRGADESPATELAATGAADVGPSRLKGLIGHQRRDLDETPTSKAPA